MAATSTPTPRAAVCIGISHLFSSSGVPNHTFADRAREVSTILRARQWDTVLITDSFQTVHELGQVASRSARAGIISALRTLRDRTWASGVRDVIIYFTAPTTRAGMEGWDRDINGPILPEEIEDILHGIYPNTRVTLFCDAPFDIGIRLPIQLPCEADTGHLDPRQFWQCAVISIWSHENRLAELLCRDRLPQAVSMALSDGINTRLCYSSIPRVRRLLEMSTMTRA